MQIEKRTLLTELRKRFGTKEQCREYLFEKRSPLGFVCPKCGSRNHYHLMDGTPQYAEYRHKQPDPSCIAFVCL